MNVITAVIDTWRRAGVRLNAGTTTVRLEQLRNALRVDIPGDVASFFLTADGMADGETAEWLTSFWSIEKILSERLERDGQDEKGHYREVAFADVMLDSWHLWFRVRRPGLLSILVEEAAEEHSSFASALERYVAFSEGWDW